MAHMSTIQEAFRALKRGEPVVFPTDTVYGIGVSVRDAQTPEILYRIKRREKRKPIAWLVGSTDDLMTYGKSVPEFAQTLVRTFWPGQLTLIVRASEQVPEAFRSSRNTIGLRMPANPTAQQLISSLGCPIATTSANISGSSSALSFESLDEEILNQVSVALKDDEQKSGVASTVIDCSFGDHPVLVRQGALSIAEIQALV